MNIKKLNISLSILLLIQVVFGPVIIKGGEVNELKYISIQDVDDYNNELTNTDDNNQVDITKESEGSLETVETEQTSEENSSGPKTESESVKNTEPEVENSTEIVAVETTEEVIIDNGIVNDERDDSSEIKPKIPDEPLVVDSMLLSTKQVIIPISVNYISDSKIDKGDSKIVDKGAPGLKSIKTYIELLSDGSYGKTFKESHVIKPMTSKLIRIGAKIPSLTAKSQLELSTQSPQVVIKPKYKPKEKSNDFPLVFKITGVFIGLISIVGMLLIPSEI